MFDQVLNTPLDQLRFLYIKCIDFQYMNFSVKEMMFFLDIENLSSDRFLFDKKRMKSFTSVNFQKPLEKGVLKICSKFTGEHPCRSVISINLQSNFFRTPYPRNTCGWLLLLLLIIVLKVKRKNLYNLPACRE